MRRFHTVRRGSEVPGNCGRAAWGPTRGYVGRTLPASARDRVAQRLVRRLVFFVASGTSARPRRAPGTGAGCASPRAYRSPASRRNSPEVREDFGVAQRSNRRAQQKNTGLLGQPAVVADALAVDAEES